MTVTSQEVPFPAMFEGLRCVKGCTVNLCIQLDLSLFERMTHTLQLILNGHMPRLALEKAKPASIDDGLCYCVLTVVLA